MAVSHSVVLYEPTEASAEVVTAAGFLAGYSSRTREAYTRICASSSGGATSTASARSRSPALTSRYARELEELGRAPATISRRLSTLAGFYRYSTEEGVI